MTLPSRFSGYIFYLVFIPLFFFYTLCFEILMNGQTPGKAALRLKVVKIDGTEARISDYIIRWSFRMIDIYFSLGSLATLFVSSTAKSQRLGDIVANTAVISLRTETKIRVADIERSILAQNYSPKYREVLQLNENEMIIVKTVLERQRLYPSEAHIQIIGEVRDILCRRLNIPKPGEEPHIFLSTLINDYIMLTR
jgi:hypothetical protein